MSLINKMLQDLDRRQALGSGAEAGVLRPAAANARHREWFWRIVTLLLTMGVAWVLWTAYQLLPRPLVTDRAFWAAEQARPRTPVAIKIEAPVAPAVAEVPAVAEAPAVAKVPAAAQLPPPAAEGLKLALQIETPVREPAKPPARPRPKAEPAPAAPVAVAAPRKKASVDKRERNAPANAAEGHFRRAALLLNHGRVSEAEAELSAAL